MVYLAIDFGKKRMGLAYCDSEERFLLSLPTWEHQVKQVDKTLAHIETLVKRYGIHAFVLGLPVNMDGTQGFMAEQVCQFGAALEQHFPECPLHYMDERLTSQIAQRMLREAGVSTRKQKGLVDQEAARQILEDFLKKKRYTETRETL
jgi:putative holliday junction resolvase